MRPRPEERVVTGKEVERRDENPVSPPNMEMVSLSLLDSP